MQPEMWLRVAGLGTWAVSSLLAGTDLLQGQMSWGQGSLWLAAFLAFGASFALVCWAPWRARWAPFALRPFRPLRRWCWCGLVETR